MKKSIKKECFEKLESIKWDLGVKYNSHNIKSKVFYEDVKMILFSVTTKIDYIINEYDYVLMKIEENYISVMIVDIKEIVSLKR